MSSKQQFISAFHEWIGVFMRHSMRGLLAHSKDHGLSMSQIGALFHLRRKGVCGVSDIGDDLGVTSAAASQMLERLVQQGLVRRSEDPHDRRGKQIVLTAKGASLLQGVIHARQSWLDMLAERLSPHEQEQIMQALQILIEKTRQLDEEHIPQ